MIRRDGGAEMERCGEGEYEPASFKKYVQLTRISFHERFTITQEGDSRGINTHSGMRPAVPQTIGTIPAQCRIDTPIG